MAGAYTHKGIIAGGHTLDQVARRAMAIDRVHALLAEKPMSAQSIAAKLEMRARTVYGYLVQLEDEGYARRTGQREANGRDLWTQDNAPEKVADDHARRVWTAPARQIGIPRDPLAAALFGPAAGAVA